MLSPTIRAPVPSLLDPDPDPVPGWTTAGCDTPSSQPQRHQDTKDSRRHRTIAVLTQRREGAKTQSHRSVDSRLTGRAAPALSLPGSRGPTERGMTFAILNGSEGQAGSSPLQWAERLCSGKLPACHSLIPGEFVIGSGAASEAAESKGPPRVGRSPFQHRPAELRGILRLASLAQNDKIRNDPVASEFVGAQVYFPTQWRPVLCSAGVPPAPQALMQACWIRVLPTSHRRRDAGATKALESSRHATSKRKGKRPVPASPRRSRCAPSTAAVGSGWRAERLRSKRQHDSTVAAVKDRRRLRRPNRVCFAMPLRLCAFAPLRFNPAMVRCLCVESRCAMSSASICVICGFSVRRCDVSVLAMSSVPPCLCGSTAMTSCAMSSRLRAFVVATSATLRWTADR